MSTVWYPPRFYRATVTASSPHIPGARVTEHLSLRANCPRSARRTLRRWCGPTSRISDLRRDTERELQYLISEAKILAAEAAALAL